MSWLFRSNLKLQNLWWHRLIKVVFLTFFSLSIILVSVTMMSKDNQMLLRKHNISIRNTLYQFTDRYGGDDGKNTIPEFFSQKGNFGLILNNRVEYISSYSLGKSICVQNPKKYSYDIAEFLYADYTNNLDYGKSPEFSFEEIVDETEKRIQEDATKRCFFVGLNDKSLLEKTNNLSGNIINYNPNIVFYIESALLVAVGAFITFIICALIYYHMILYVVYGNKRERQ